MGMLYNIHYSFTKPAFCNKERVFETVSFREEGTVRLIFSGIQLNLIHEKNKFLNQFKLKRAAPEKYKSENLRFSFQSIIIIIIFDQSEI